MVPVRRTLGLGLAVLAAALLLGCGGGSGSSAGGGSAGTSAAGSEAPSGQAVAVVEKEFSIAVATKRLSPGTYTFTIDNRGQASHNLTIEGPGVKTTSSSVVGGGQSGELTVTLAAGSYQLWCSIGSHRAQGMDTTIEVG